MHGLGAFRDPSGQPRRPDAAAFARVLGDPLHEQQAGDVLCACAAARTRSTVFHLTGGFDSEIGEHPWDEEFHAKPLQVCDMHLAAAAYL